MSAKIFKLPDKPKEMTISEFLRSIADDLEKEGIGPDDFVVVASVRYEGEDAKQMRTRVHKHNATLLETMGALALVSYDYAKDD
jgi:hypothetical protein